MSMSSERYLKVSGGEMCRNFFPEAAYDMVPVTG